MSRRILTTVAVTTVALLCTPSVASAAIKIKAIYFDPPGSDTTSKLNQEYVVIENTGSNRINLDDWKLRDQANHVYRFVDFKLKAGHRMRVHTGHGQDDGNDVYWDSGWYIWNNDGDKATLRKDNGTVCRSPYGVRRPQSLRNTSTPETLRATRSRSRLISTPIACVLKSSTAACSIPPRRPQKNFAMSMWRLVLLDRIADDWGRISEGGIWAEFRLTKSD